MELRTLRYFLAIVKYENITHAAKHLHITQPTLSRQMTQLEDTLGVQLFIRGKRNLVVTKEGELLKQRAEDIIDIADRIIQEVHEFDPQIGGEIIVGSGELASTKRLAQAFAKFQTMYPNVRFYFNTRTTDQIKEDMEKGLIDLGVLLNPIDTDTYTYLPLPIKERWGILLPPDDALANYNEIGIDDIIDKPLIMVRREEMKCIIKHWFGNAYEHLHIVGHHNLSTNAARMVCEGIGYAITIEGATDLYDERKMVFRPFQPELTSSSMIAWKKHQTHSPVVTAFLKFLISEFENEA